jgi:hypothetical protein
MLASALIGELIVLMVKHGDRQVVDLDGCDPVTGVLFSEDSETAFAELGLASPLYLRMDR